MTSNGWPMGYKNDTVKEQIRLLMERYPYFSINISQSVLYWSCGATSERILLAHIDSIEFFEDHAVLHSEVGTSWGYNRVEFYATGAVLPPMEGVIYYNYGR